MSLTVVCYCANSLGTLCLKVVKMVILITRCLTTLLHAVSLDFVVSDVGSSVIVKAVKVCLRLWHKKYIFTYKGFYIDQA